MSAKSPRVSPRTVLIFLLVIAIIPIFACIAVSLKPNILGDSKQRLLQSLQDAPEFGDYYQIISNAPPLSLEKKQFQDHWVRIDAIGWNEEKTIMCVLYTIRVPQNPPLTIFGDTIDKVKSLADARLQNEKGDEYPPVNGGLLAFATDVVDTGSFLFCFQDIPDGETRFKLSIGNLEDSRNIATFTITKPRNP